MNTKWLLAGSGLVGVFLAFLLIQRPDTGGTVDRPTSVFTEPVATTTVDQAPTEPTAPSTPEPASPSDAEPGPEEPGMRRPGLPTPSTAARPGEIPGPNPLAAEAQEKRSLPEAVQSGKASIPWTLIRRNLNRVESDQATELSNVTNQLVLDLRRMRRDPDSFNYGELEQRQRDLQQSIRSGGFDSDEEISTMLGRVDEILTEYQQLKAAQ